MSSLHRFFKSRANQLNIRDMGVKIFKAEIKVSDETGNDILPSKIHM